jgi:hypothetical protein
MSARTRSIAVAVVGLWVVPAAVVAQAAPAPEVHYLTVTRFQAPQGADRDKVMMWIDTVMVPQARINPNVTSFHVANHNWGANSNEIVLISEYPSWAAIEAECAPCDKWNEENEPKAGTPEAKKWEEIGAVFGKYYGGHADEIYAIPAARSKR